MVVITAIIIMTVVAILGKHGHIMEALTAGIMAAMTMDSWRPSWWRSGDVCNRSGRGLMQMIDRKARVGQSPNGRIAHGHAPVPPHSILKVERIL
jgi:hypothetical protein